MDSSNQIFSPSRYLLFMRKYCFESRGRLLVTAAIVAMLPAVAIPGMAWILGTYDQPSQIDRFLGYELFIVNFLLVTLAAYCGSLAYGLLGDKDRRIALLTNPASALEKTAVWLTIFIIGFIIIFAAGFLIGDAIRVLTAPSYAAEGAEISFMSLDFILSQGYSATPAMMQPDSGSMAEWLRLKEQFEFRAAVNLSAVLISAFGGQALYILGSTVWPKNSFIKTLCFCQVAGILFIVLSNIGDRLFLHGSQRFRFADTTDNWQILITFDVVAALVTIGILCLAHARFKEWEVIKRW